MPSWPTPHTMSRSRIVLLVAWGLLASGSVIHLMQSSGGDDQTEQADADPPAELADRGAGKRGPIPPPRSVEPASGGQPVDTEGTEIASPDGRSDDTARFDAPETWPAPVRPATVATVVGDGIAARATPDAGPDTHWFPNPTQFGGDRTFLVVDDTSSPDWIKVSLPVMPNGQEGWIPRAAVELSTVTQRAEVDLSDATVTVWDGDEVVATTRAVTGRVSTPTPLGRFYVRDIIAQSDPDGDFGPWILALSGFSEVLETFEGGLPALAIHGTDEPEQVGNALSAGCLRVPNEVITLLAETVPLGTPVTVVA